MFRYTHALIFFQLTCFSALGHDADSATVHQAPGPVKVKEGGSVNLSCSLSGNFAEPVIVSVEWYTNVASVGTAQRHNVSGNQNWTFSLPLNPVQRNHSGRYFCKVSVVIPQPKDLGNGSGTILKVKDSTSLGATDEPSPIVVWTSVLAAVLFVGTGFVIYCKSKGKKRKDGIEERCREQMTRKGGGNGRAESNGGGSESQVDTEVLYAKLNIPSSPNAHEKDGHQENNCVEPQGGEKTSDSTCVKPATEENVVYAEVHTSRTSSKKRAKQ
ncbi:hypothetical protein MATL_G00057960 [Megalops atlanticus]|uniref:Ig-like domain-containing protein n=1 Tax=Megalops atlanticus TaxID=7932 RepID=A0A9D3T928_MEGAT|nr:hypothetical protein MATL_G00057960 [Megalops atlanticus]